MSDFDIALGEKIRSHRKAMGWSQSELVTHLRNSGLSNYHQTTVSRIESGETSLKMSDAVVIFPLLGIKSPAISPCPNCVRVADQLQQLAHSIREAS